MTPLRPTETWLKPVLAVTKSDWAVRPSLSCSVFSAGQTLPGFSLCVCDTDSLARLNGCAVADLSLCQL